MAIARGSAINGNLTLGSSSGGASNCIPESSTARGSGSAINGNYTPGSISSVASNGVPEPSSAKGSSGASNGAPDLSSMALLISYRWCKQWDLIA
jgi:hypothetical protein